jgi:hypothetical protein
MEEQKKELNLVEILKNCPKGIKLWSPCWGKLTYNGIDWREYDAWDYESNDVYPIQTTWVEEELLFNPYGQYIDGGDVMLFPSKDNRDWSTFRRPFNEGDFIYTECNSGNKWISIYKFKSEEGLHLTYANLNINDETIGINHKGGLCEDKDIKYQRLASEAEIEQILKALHTIGYNWNNEAKKFEDIEEDKPKWNPDTLQPFDKVLIRDEDSEYWGGDFYLYTDKETGSDFIYSCVSSNYKICIPYNEDTKQMLGTNKEQPVFYRL